MPPTASDLSMGLVGHPVCSCTASLDSPLRLSALSWERGRGGPVTPVIWNQSVQEVMGNWPSSQRGTW